MNLEKECDHLDGIFLTFLKSLSKWAFTGVTASEWVKFHRERQILLLLANQVEFFIENRKSDCSIRNDVISIFRSYFQRNPDRLREHREYLAELYGLKVSSYVMIIVGN